MFVTVTQTTQVYLDRYFKVEVPDGLTDAEAESIAIGRVASGAVQNPYDTEVSIEVDGTEPDYDAEVRS